MPGGAGGHGLNFPACRQINRAEEGTLIDCRASSHRQTELKMQKFPVLFSLEMPVADIVCSLQLSGLMSVLPVSHTQSPLQALGAA